MKKAARKTLGVAVVLAYILAVAAAMPARAETVCQIAPNGSQYCYDNGQGPGIGGSNTGSAGGAPVGGSYGNVPPPPPQIQMPAPQPAPAPAPVSKPPVQAVPAPVNNTPVRQVPPAPVPAPAQNYVPAPSAQLPAPAVQVAPPADAVIPAAPEVPAEDSVKTPEAEKGAETKSDEKDSVTATVSATPSSEASQTSSSSAPEASESISGIDVLRASAAQPITIVLLAILLIAGVLLAYHLRVLPFGRNRKNPSTNESR